MYSVFILTIMSLLLFERNDVYYVNYSVVIILVNIFRSVKSFTKGPQLHTLVSLSTMSRWWFGSKSGFSLIIFMAKSTAGFTPFPIVASGMLSETGNNPAMTILPFPLPWLHSVIRMDMQAITTPSNQLLYKRPQSVDCVVESNIIILAKPNTRPQCSV